MNNSRSHREMYPEQYAHALCGKTVVRITSQPHIKPFIVERVVTSMFGTLIVLPSDPKMAYSVRHCHFA